MLADLAADPLDGESAYQVTDDAMPEPLDFTAIDDSGTDTLGQLKDLYQTADTMSQASVEGNFDRILERQRQLISEYFQESSGLDAFEPDDAAATSADRSAPFGFDTAQSLSGLGGDLRGSQAEPAEQP